MHPLHLLLYVRAYLKGLLGLYLFYLGGHFLLGFPFPYPRDLLHLALGTLVGFGLGLLYHRIWPLPPKQGLERVVRLFVLLPPAFMLGIGLVVLLQAQVALHFIVPLLAWLTPDHGAQARSTP
ncbi:hypothetical protein [Thermus sp.]|uniref:hypothetical protein n=1 Tax=Thermus sp. TaxID=275 RepID=UPI00307F74C8